MWKNLFADTATKPNQYESSVDDGQAMGGAYSESFGAVTNGMSSLFHPATKTYQVTQEFGTRPGIMVLWGLIRENAGWTTKTTAPEVMETVRKELLETFYIDQCSWKNSILERGEKILVASWA
jgi:hypothetical protein